MLAGAGRWGWTMQWSLGKCLTESVARLGAASSQEPWLQPVSVSQEN